MPEFEYQEDVGGLSPEALFTRRFVLESMGAKALVAVKRQLLEEISERESEINEINDVLNGYGVHSLEDEAGLLGKSEA